MIRTILAVSALLAGCSMSDAPDDAATQRDMADLIISGGVVIHPESESEPQVEDIVVADGRIVAVGADLADRYDAAIYDASGRFVIPGLADMHSHFGNGIIPGSADDTTPVLARHLYFGNTTILNLGSAEGWPERIDELRAAMNAGTLKGPRLLSVGTLFTVPGSHPVSTIYPPELQAQIADIVTNHDGDGVINLAPLRGTTLATTPENLAAEVRRLGSWGADAIKLTIESGPPEFGDDHPKMPPEMVAAAANAAGAFGIPVLCHVSSLDELEECLANGGDGAVHAITPEEDEPLPDDLEARMAAAHFALIPTVSLFDGWRRYGDDPALLDQPALAGVLSDYEHGWLSSPGMQEAFGSDPAFDAVIRRMAAHVKRFHGLGGLMVAGSDVGNPYRIAGFALHEELAFYVEGVGLTPREALRTATLNAARLVGDENEWGAIREGLVADLVILSGNPLDDIHNTLAIADVIKAGEIVERANLLLH